MTTISDSTAPVPALCTRGGLRVCDISEFRDGDRRRRALVMYGGNGIGVHAGWYHLDELVVA